MDAERADGTRGELAVRLAMATSRLRARLREEVGGSFRGLSMSQVIVLKRLVTNGPSTASLLAAAEYVSEQAIAQTLAEMKRGGLVRAEPDPNDGRKSLLHVTEAGRELAGAMMASRDAWMMRAIDATVAPEETPELEKAIELLERLAAAPAGTRSGNR